METPDYLGHEDRDPAHEDADPDERYRRILERVERAGLAVPAGRAVHAVLETLGEALPYGTAAYLASSLPDAVGGSVGRHFPADSAVVNVERAEFEATVVRRCGCAADEAEQLIRAVTGAVAGVVPLGVMVNVEHVMPEPLLDLIHG